MFHNAVSYAVELRHLDANPIDRTGWKAPAVAQTVDRRVVAGPAQICRLLAAVRGLSDRGQHLEAFYACLYYAYLRPSEAVMLKQADCRLPGRGWGRIDLAASAARAGKDWTDDGAARQARGLKHRAQHETRSIPIPPVLVQLLRAHLKRYGTAPDGRIFRTVRGGLIQDSAYSAVWAEARAAALTPAQHASPLARRPYDLRHAGVSLALNAGVPATEVARRAGHSVAVLLKIYAHCIDGQADAANKRITDALGSDDTSDDQGQDDPAILTACTRARSLPAPRQLPAPPLMAAAPRPGSCRDGGSSSMRRALAERAPARPYVDESISGAWLRRGHAGMSSMSSWYQLVPVRKCRRLPRPVTWVPAGSGSPPGSTTRYSPAGWARSAPSSARASRS